MQPADVRFEGESRPSADRADGAESRAGHWFRSRTPLVVSAAVLTELVAVAATGNQGVTDAVNRHLGDDGRGFADYVAGAWRSLITYRWRFTPASGQSTSDWAADFAAIGVLFVLTALLMIPIVRGVARFWRVLLGAWIIVAAITPVAIMVRNVISIPSRPGPGQSKFGQAVYDYADFGPAIVAGIVLGLLTGLVAAVVVRATRREVGADGSPVEGEYDDERFERFEQREGYPAPGGPGYPPPAPPPYYPPGEPPQAGYAGPPWTPGAAAPEQGWTPGAAPEQGWTPGGVSPEQQTTALPPMQEAGPGPARSTEPVPPVPPAPGSPQEARSDWYGYEQADQAPESPAQEDAPRQEDVEQSDDPEQGR